MAVADLRKRHVGGQAARVIVLGLWRYDVNPKDFRLAAHEDYSDEHSLSSQLAYDVEVCDVCAIAPRRQLRCIVSSSLYRSLRKGALVPGHVVEIADWKLVYDESQLSGPATTVVKSLGASTAAQCTCGAHVHYDLVPRLRTPATPSLVGQRALCLNAWTREDPVGGRRAGVRRHLLASSRAECGVLLRGRTPIGELRLGRAAGPICGRVLRKERLATYVPSRRPQPYPFFLHAVLGDESGTVHAYFWHQMALACFDCVRENDVVVCRDFAVKPYVRDAGRREIALNPCADPSDYVCIVPPHLAVAVGLAATLPAIRDDFVAVADLYRGRRRRSEDDVGHRRRHDDDDGELVADDEFSVVGLVVHACPWQRYRDAAVPDEFYMSRLLALRDESSDRLVLLRVYAFSDETAFLGLSAKQLVAVTHCCYGRAGSEELLVPARLDELMVVSTSASSQVYTFERSDTERGTFKAAVATTRFEKDAKVVQTARWLDGADNSDEMCLSLTDEDLCYDRILPLPVPLDIQLDVLTKVIQLKNNFQVVSGVRLLGVLSDLDYRENRVLFVHATLSSVSVTCFLPNAPTAGARRGVQSVANQADGDDQESRHGPHPQPALSRPMSSGAGVRSGGDAPVRPYEFRVHKPGRRRLIQSSSDDSEASHEYPASPPPPLAHRKRHGDVAVPTTGPTTALHLPRELRRAAAQRSAGRQPETGGAESVVDQGGSSDSAGVMTRGRRARLQVGASSSSSSAVTSGNSDSDASSVYLARPHAPLVPASHSEASDEDTRLPHLRCPLVTSPRRSSAAVAGGRSVTQDSGLGVSPLRDSSRFGAYAGNVAESNGQAEDTFTKRTVECVMQDVPDEADLLDCCARKPASASADDAGQREAEVSLQLLTLNQDVAVRVPLRRRHALSRLYRLDRHGDETEADDDAAVDVLLRGQVPHFDATEAGMRRAAEFVDTLKSRVSEQRLLVMLDVYRTSCSHVHVTYMGALLAGEL